MHESKIHAQSREINRIDKKFRKLKSMNQKALICYIVAGYPDIRTSEDIITSLINGGADIIEIGIPFSDPIADGSTIQDAIQNSLTSGTTPDMCLESPNTSEKRLKIISKICTGFLYVISIYGITGERKGFDEYTIESIKRVKKVIADNLPLAVGFGISNPQHVRYMIDAGADGAIIGSAIIKKIKEIENKELLLNTLNRFAHEMKNSCKTEKC